MKIDIGTKEKVALNTLNVGDVFLYNGDVYVKIDCLDPHDGICWVMVVCGERNQYIPLTLFGLALVEHKRDSVLIVK